MRREHPVDTEDSRTYRSDDGQDHAVDQHSVHTFFLPGAVYPAMAMDPKEFTEDCSRYSHRISSFDPGTGLALR